MDESSPRRGEVPDDVSTSLSPIAVHRIRHSEIEQLATQIGAAAGTAVVLLRDVRRQFNNSGLWKSAPLDDLRSSAKGRGLELRHAAELRAQEWRQAMHNKTEESEQYAGYGLIRSERNSPQIAVAAGLLGFIVGIAFGRFQEKHHPE